MDERTIEKRERAYAVWATDGERSPAKTAQLCGISVRQIYRYLREDDWQGRFDSTFGISLRRVQELSKQQLHYGMPVVLRRLFDIVGRVKPRLDADGQPVTDDAGNVMLDWSSSDKDAVAAAKVLATWAWGAGDMAAPMDDSPPMLGASIERPLTAAEILEANYSAANTRRNPTARGGKRV